MRQRDAAAFQAGHAQVSATPGGENRRNEIQASGRVIGNIKCHTLAMAEGCFFQGAIKMPGEETKPLTSVEKRQSGQDEAEPGTED